MWLRDLAYRAHERRLHARVTRGPLPAHIGLIVDGNRRWARQLEFEDPRQGHRHGAEHLVRLMEWCGGLGIGHVTVFLASVDNLAKRTSTEVDFLMSAIETVVRDRLAAPGLPWRIELLGRLDLLPPSTAAVLKRARDDTRSRTGPVLTLAVGYGSREEIVDAVRDVLIEADIEGRSLRDVAESLTPEAIGAQLDTAEQPEPELIIRTSGEIRLSGFLLWQSASAELHFCDSYWPSFRRLDLLRALRSYADKTIARARDPENRPRTSISPVQR